MLDKAIQYGKEHRKPYRGSKRFDKSCRNHGGCGWCLGNRMHSTKVREAKAQEIISECEISHDVNELEFDSLTSTMLHYSKRTLIENFQCTS